MVKPNPIGHDQVSLNLHSSKEELCSSALVPCSVFITFILLGQFLCLPAGLHTLSLSHSPCSGAWSISVCLLEQQAICLHGSAMEGCKPHRSPSCCHHVQSKMEWGLLTLYLPGLTPPLWRTDLPWYPLPHGTTTKSFYCSYCHFLPAMCPEAFLNSAALQLPSACCIVWCASASSTTL